MARAMSAIIILNFLIRILSVTKCSSAVQLKFTNFECHVHDPTFLTFRLCKLKVIRRGVVTLNADIELHNEITTFLIQSALFKKSYSYKQILMSNFDFCKYQLGYRGNILASILMSFINEFTNANHTCPYEHNLIVKDLLLAEEKFKLIPLPYGDYMEKLSLIFNGELKTQLKVYFSRME